MLLNLLHSILIALKFLYVETYTYGIVVLISHRIASAYWVLVYNTTATLHLNPDSNCAPPRLLRQGIHRDPCDHGNVVCGRPSAGRPNRLLSMHACPDNGKSGLLVQWTMDSLKIYQTSPIPTSVGRCRTVWFLILHNYTVMNCYHVY